MPKYGFEFDPFKLTGVTVPKGKQKEALEAAAEVLIQDARQAIGEGRSPVSGGPWKKTYTKAYKDFKADFSSSGKVNLELTGEMLDDLDAEVVGGKIFYGVSSDQAGKAEGNNIGSYGGSADEGRARRFIPLKGEKFKSEIIQDMKKAMLSIVEDADE